MSSYNHTQQSPIGRVLLIVAVVEIALAIAFWRQWEAAVILLVVAAIIIVMAFSFSHLTVRDEGDCLAIRFGPLPLFRKRIPYASMTAVEPDQSSFVDGWGIHYNPWKGWIYNLWGFHCVRIVQDGKSVRIGTDDRDNLTRFLRAKIADDADH